MVFIFFNNLCQIVYDFAHHVIETVNIGIIHGLLLDGRRCLQELTLYQQLGVQGKVLRHRIYCRFKHLCHVIKVGLKLFSNVDSLPFLLLHHDPQCLPGLMRSVFVDEVVHVDEQQVEVVQLLHTFLRIWCPDENVNKVQKVDKDRVVELLQLALVVIGLGVKTTDTRSLQGSNDGIVSCKHLSKHLILVLKRWGWWLWCTTTFDIVICVMIDVLHWRQWEGTDTLALTHTAALH